MSNAGVVNPKRRTDCSLTSNRSSDGAAEWQTNQKFQPHNINLPDALLGLVKLHSGVQDFSTGIKH